MDDWEEEIPEICPTYQKNNSFNRSFDRERENRGNRGASKNFDFNDEMDIRSDCIGKIIGRGGANIQRIQSDYNVRLDLDKSRSVIKVSSNSESSIREAMQHITEQMDSNDRGANRGGNDRFNRGGNYGERRNRYGEGSNNNFNGQNRNSYDGNNCSHYDNNKKDNFYNNTAQEEIPTSNGIIDWAELNKKAVGFICVFKGTLISFDFFTGNGT